MITATTDRKLAMTQNENEMVVIESNDVLCGRGKVCFHHEGNDRFRVLIAEHASTYQMAQSKKGKMQVILLVVNIVIARGGRFLVRNKDGSWSDGGRKQGKKKVGHAFRDALRGRVKCISEIQRAMSQDDSSIDTLDSDDYDDFDGFLQDLGIDPIELEPARDWWNAKNRLDRGFANDLLNFFVTEQTEHPTVIHKVIE